MKIISISDGNRSETCQFNIVHLFTIDITREIELMEGVGVIIPPMKDSQ